VVFEGVRESYKKGLQATVVPGELSSARFVQLVEKRGIAFLRISNAGPEKRGGFVGKDEKRRTFLLTV